MENTVENVDNYRVKKHIEGTENLRAAMQKFHTQGNQLAKDGQRLVESLAKDLTRTGDIRLVHDFLMNNIPVAVSASAFKDWLLAFAPVKEPVTDKEKKVAGVVGLVYDKNGKLDLENGQVNPWWKFKPKETSAFNLYGALINAIKNAERAETREENVKVKGTDYIPEPLLNDLKKLADRYEKVAVADGAVKVKAA